MAGKKVFYGACVIDSILSQLSVIPILTPQGTARGGLKENGQNPDSGSQKNDTVS